MSNGTRQSCPRWLLYRNGRLTRTARPTMAQSTSRAICRFVFSAASARALPSARTKPHLLFRPGAAARSRHHKIINKIKSGQHRCTVLVSWLPSLYCHVASSGMARFLCSLVEASPLPSFSFFSIGVAFFVHFGKAFSVASRVLSSLDHLLVYVIRRFLQCLESHIGFFLLLL